MPSRPHPLFRQSLQHPLLVRMCVDPLFHHGKHLHLNGVVPVEKSGMTKDGHDGVDCLMRVDFRV